MLLDVLATELGDDWDEDEVLMSGWVAMELDEKLDDKLVELDEKPDDRLVETDDKFCDKLLDELTATLVLSLLWGVLAMGEEEASLEAALETAALPGVLAAGGALSEVDSPPPPHAVSSKGKAASKSIRGRCISQFQLNVSAIKIGHAT
jgi:hypothetical protein